MSTRLLRYQLRFADGHEPETLIATDVAHARSLALTRAFDTKSAVSLWRDGRWVADYAAPADRNFGPIEAEVEARLVGAGFYLFGQARGG